MTLDDAMKWGGDPRSGDVICTLAAEVRRLQAENASLRLYAPARRAQESVKTAPIGECNHAFFGIVETDEEFAERAGRQVTEVAI